jgi:hypothetical protein
MRVLATLAFLIAGCGSDECGSLLSCADMANGCVGAAPPCGGKCSGGNAFCDHNQWTCECIGDMAHFPDMAKRD